MLTIRELNALKKEASETNINKWKPGKNISWIDCFNPDESELKKISELTKLPLKSIKENLNPKKKAHVDVFNNYSVISFHGPCEDQTNHKTATISVIIFKNGILTIHTKAMISLEKIRRMQKSQLAEIMNKGAYYFMCVLMDNSTDDFFHSLEAIEENINKLEDQVITAPSGEVSKRIFIQKRNLIYTYKSLIANREVISSLERQHSKSFNKEDLSMLKEVYSDTTHLIDLVTSYRDILTSLLDAYLSSISNSMNKVMQTLTLITAFIMVPTLIAGIYGMNFQRTGPLNMPELYWAFGYPFAIGLMVVSVIFLYMLFRKKGWL